MLAEFSASKTPRMSRRRAHVRGAGSRWVLALATLLLIVLANGPATALGGSRQIEGKLTQFPLVAQLDPNCLTVLQHQPEYRVAQMMARYDALILDTGYGCMRPQFVPFLARIKQLNSRIAIFMLWPLYKKDCNLLSTQPGALEQFLIAMGTGTSLIDGLFLDGGSVSSRDCGVLEVLSAMRKYRAIVNRMLPHAVMVANGLHLDRPYGPCNFDGGEGWLGFLDAATIHRLVNGGLSEGGIARFIDPYFQRRDTSRLARVSSWIAETCSWQQRTLQPGVAFSMAKEPTPWWNETRVPTGRTWRSARLNFAVCILIDCIFIYTSGKSGATSREGNYERMYWLDYYAVDHKTGRPPSHGASTRETADDALVEQRLHGGYLGAPLGGYTMVPKKIGAVGVREFKCGYVIANWSPYDHVFTPRLETQLIGGRQDAEYDDGTSWQSYRVRKLDALVVLKKECLSAAARRAIRSGVRPN